MSLIPTTSSRENEPSASPNQGDLVVKGESCIITPWMLCDMPTGPSILSPELPSADLHGYDQGAISLGLDDDFVQIQAGDIVIA